MSHRNERQHANSKPTNPPANTVSSGSRAESSSTSQENQTIVSNEELVAELKRRVHENRLPPDLKEQILADDPPPEVLEQMYRDLQENGGLSSEEFLASLGLDAEPQP